MVRVPRPGIVGLIFALLLVGALAGFLGSGLPEAAAQTPGVTGVGTWVQQDNYGSSTTTGGISILGVSCVAYSGYEYCIGGQNLQKLTNPDISDVFYASVSSTGTLGPWVETTDYGATSGTSGAGGLGIEWPSCVQYGGYVYCVGGATNSGITSSVYYAQLSSSGVGAWTETTDYGAASGNKGTGGAAEFQLSCVADSGYIYCVGGSSKVFYAQLSANGVGPWKETTDYGAASGDAGSGGVNISSQACVDDNGTIFCVGGTVDYSPVSDVFYANLTSSGVGPWTETTDYGASSGDKGTGGVPIYGTTCTVYLSTLICVNGDTTGNSGTNGVYYAKDPVDLVWIPTAPFPGAGYWEFCDVPSPSSPHMVCAGGGGSDVTSGTIQTTQSTTGTTTTSTASTTSTTSSVVETTQLTSSEVTSTTSSVVETTQQTSSEVTATTAPTSSGSSIPLIGGIILALIVIAGVAYWLWRRGSTQEKPPPPGVSPPPPPPLYTTDQTTETEPCEVKLQSSEKDSEFEVDVDVSSYWKPPVGLPYYSPKTAEDGHPKSDLAQYFEDQIKKRKSWDEEKLGTAICASDGAAVGGSVDAGAKIWLSEGTPFPWNLFNGDQRRLLATVRSEGETAESVLPLEAKAKGWTKLELEVESEHGKGAVSAAVLVATRAHASVLDPEWHLLEMMETSIEVVVKLLEILERVVKELKVEGKYELKVVKALEEGIEELKELINAYREAKGALDQARALTKAVEKSKEVIQEFYHYLGYEVALMYLVPLAIEHFGKKLFAKADVEVEAEGGMNYTIGSCQPGSVKASASMVLEVEKGEVEKPNPAVYVNARLSRRIGTCTSSGELNIDIDSEVSASGKAKDGGEGVAYVDSLWAAAWVWCCKAEDDGDHPGEPSPIQFDSTFGARFVIPPPLRYEHQEMDANGIRNLVEETMTSKLDDLLLQGAQAGTLPCPAEDPQGAEEALKNILQEWLANIQDKFGLFTPGSQ